MDTLDRFLLREFLSYFVLILLGLSLLFLGVDFLSKFWNMHLPMSRILEIYAYRVPGALQQFVPVACLMATLLVLTTMSRQNEVLALYSSGVSTLRLISTFIAAVATVSTLSFLIFDSLVPTLNRRQMLAHQSTDAADLAQAGFGERGFWYRSNHLIYRVGQFLPEASKLLDVHIYMLDSRFAIRQTIYAKEAHFQNDEWVLKQGTIVTYPEDDRFPISAHFDEKRGTIPEKPSDFKTIKIQEDTMRLRDLRAYIKRNSAYGLDTTHQRVNYHERMALVFTPLVFILLAMPFAVHPLKSQSTARSVAFCFVVVFCYLLMFRLSLSIGKSGHIPPFIAAWAPNLIFLGISLMGLTRR